mmetsp:Transcript_11959/g.30520  ORF Transcript_11959/g.30520 Transcript_11959/m.30520 type:complete len:412 (-) Transcript_11959:597-1832(-)
MTTVLVSDDDDDIEDFQTKPSHAPLCVRRRPARLSLSRHGQEKEPVDQQTKTSSVASKEEKVVKRRRISNPSRRDSTDALLESETDFPSVFFFGSSLSGKPEDPGPPLKDATNRDHPYGSEISKVKVNLPEDSPREPVRKLSKAHPAPRDACLESVSVDEVCETTDEEDSILVQPFGSGNALRTSPSHPDPVPGYPGFPGRNTCTSSPVDRPRPRDAGSAWSDAFDPRGAVPSRDSPRHTGVDASPSCPSAPHWLDRLPHYRPISVLSGAAFDAEPVYVQYKHQFTYAKAAASPAGGGDASEGAALADALVATRRRKKGRAKGRRARAGQASSAGTKRRGKAPAAAEAEAAPRTKAKARGSVDAGAAGASAGRWVTKEGAKMFITASQALTGTRAYKAYQTQRKRKAAGRK